VVSLNTNLCSDSFLHILSALGAGHTPVQVPLVFSLCSINTVSYALPLIVIALSSWVLPFGKLAAVQSYAALLFNTTVTLAYLLSVVSAGGSLTLLC
jgi:hypothetical protein